MAITTLPQYFIECEKGLRQIQQNLQLLQKYLFFLINIWKYYYDFIILQYERNRFKNIKGEI